MIDNKDYLDALRKIIANDDEIKEKNFLELEKEIESLKAQLEEAKHLVRFMCDTWDAVDKFVYKNCQNLENYPVVQGTSIQLGLREIGNQECDRVLAGRAINAMIEAQEKDNAKS